MACAEPVMSGLPGRSRPGGAVLWALRLGARAGAPGVGRLLRRAGVWDQARWEGAPRRETRGRWHGCRMRLDLSDYHQRGAYFYGHLLDLAVQAFLMGALRPGDDCIDFGANIGLLTMAAARAVGPAGRVLAVEPNPDVFERLRWHVEANGLSCVRTARSAASDRDATMTLSIPPTGNTGAGTLGKLLPRHGDRTSATYPVPLRRGDDLVAEEWGAGGDASLLVKIDVEGHETALLRGLEQTVTRRRPIVLAEINPYMLTTNGSSAEQLLALMRSWGYRAFDVSAARPGLARRPRPVLRALPDSWRPSRTCNAVFMHSGSQPAPHIGRMMWAPAGSFACVCDGD